MRSASAVPFFCVPRSSKGVVCEGWAQVVGDGVLQEYAMQAFDIQPTACLVQKNNYKKMQENYPRREYHVILFIPLCLACLKKCALFLQRKTHNLT